MNSNTLSDFRTGLYGCFLKSRDALMNTSDALLTDCNAVSVAELSLSPFFTRKWPSLYKGLQKASVDRAALQKLFARYAPKTEQRLVLGIDASSIARPHSKTAKDRTYVHASNLPDTSKPVVAGWQFSALCVMPKTPSSWTYVLDNQRIESEKTQGEVAARQLKAVVPLLKEGSLVLGDGYYGSAVFLGLTEGIACDKLLRLAKNRVLYYPAPPRPLHPGAGRPCLDGEEFNCKNQQTQGEPCEVYRGEEAEGKEIEVCCWKGLHFKQARSVNVCVLRVTRAAAKETKRDPKVSWFLFCGEKLPPLEEIPALYARRYSIEHGFRVDKQDLLWGTPRLRTPEAFEYWTCLVASVRNQLYLGRELGVSRRGWERKEGSATPSQVRRAMGTIIGELGTPACVSQVRGYSKGRQKGAIVKRAMRYQVIYKATLKTKTTPQVV